MVFWVRDTRHLSETFWCLHHIVRPKYTPYMGGMRRRRHELFPAKNKLVVYNLWETGMSTETNIRWLYSEDKAVI